MVIAAPAPVEDIVVASPTTANVPQTPLTDADYVEAVDASVDVEAATTTDEAPARGFIHSKKRALLLVTAALLVVGAVIGTLIATMHPSSSQAKAIAVGNGNGELSVCYDAYQSWTPGMIAQNFRKIKERFNAVRTFQTRGINNHIVEAANAGLSIYAGVWIQGSQGEIDQDMQAVVDGARAHPDVVKAVFVGNEELLTGKWDQDFVIGHVRRMKQMLRDAGLGYIKVGAVQTDGSWFGGWDLAQECDIMGVNIHPYFGGSPDKPMDDLVARWDGVYSWYGDKLVLTEIGWPTEGTPLNGHVPSMETAKQLYADVAAWAAAGNGGEAPAYFMYNDNPTK
ncbi:hypothetical protein As57867_020899, partial [Aphanomyces stellatus]